MIVAHCPHEAAIPPGELCVRCEAAGAAVVRLAPPSMPSGFLFESSPARGLSTGELRALLGRGAADEALVERKLMGEDELVEAGLDHYDEDPEGAERGAYEEALAWRLNLKLSAAVGEDFGPAFLLVIPGTSPSWAGELLRADDAEVRSALLAQKTGAWGPPPRMPSGSLMMLFLAEGGEEDLARGDA